MEWVEAVGKTVDEAVAEAMDALGEEARDAVEVEVLTEPKKGFLGIGGQEATVRVTKKPKKKRRRGRGRSRDSQKDDGKRGGEQPKQQKQQKSRSGKEQPRAKKDQNRNRRDRKPKETPDRVEKKKVAVDSKADDKPDIEQQAEVAKEFAEGLVKAFGVEGTVETRIEDGILYIDINGDQTEALVGRRGVVVQAIHELTRTVIQRKTFGAPRMRLDVAGYAARRREALKIYAGRLAESVKEDQREAMLEPMNAADRKVVHDAIADIEGVRSYSEGEEPNRSVVVAPVD
jgi:spoIIIJ-associated protein